MGSGSVVGMGLKSMKSFVFLHALLLRPALFSVRDLIPKHDTYSKRAFEGMQCVCVCRDVS